MIKKLIILLLFITTPAFAGKVDKMKCETVNKTVIKRCEDEFAVCYVYSSLYQGGIHCIKKQGGTNE